MTVRFQLRRDTSSNWSSINPTLALGEPGVETDTLKLKIGTGATNWNSLAYSTTTDFADLDNTPTTLSGYGITDAATLDDFSVTVATANGNGNLSYDSETGEFVFTPPELIFSNISNTPTTLSGYGITDAATDAQGSLADTAVQPGDNVSQLTNDSGYLTDYTVTQSDVTQHQSALSITESQITDLQNYLTDYTVTQSDVTQHQSALSITESQITDLQNYLTDSYFSGGIGVDYAAGTISIGQNVGTTENVTFNNITTTGYLAGPESFVIDPAAIGNNTGTVVIAGNLQVDGTTTTINSTTVDVGDKNIVLGSNATADTQNNGAGITINRPESTDATVSWNETTDSWDFSNDVNVNGNLNSSGNLSVSSDITGNNLTITGSHIGDLDISGNLSVSGDIDSTSDLNLKTNINTITASMDKVSKLRGVNFEWKDNGKKSLGVIAQEVEKVLPELVNQNNQGNKTVQYANMIGLLIEALKELNEKIERLENK